MKIGKFVLGVVLLLSVLTLTASAEEIEQNYGGELPARYDFRDYYKIPDVRDQGNYGVCWSFGTTGTVELNLIKKGMADESINLSEFELIYSAEYSTPDPLGILKDTYSFGGTKGCFLHDSRGSSVVAACIMSDGLLYADEDEVRALNYEEACERVHVGSSTAPGFHSLDLSSVKDLPYRKNRVRLMGYGDVAKYFMGEYRVGSDEIIKRELLEYGALSLSYRSNSNCYKEGAYYNPVNTGMDHEVVLIGWDDNYPKTNFKTTPPGNGAWIIRNSWGVVSGDEGYFYISYYDKTDKGVTYFDAALCSDNEVVYHYDGVNNVAKSKTQLSGKKAANVYRSVSPKGDTLVGLCAEISVYEEQDVKMTLYYNLTDPKNPESGIPVRVSKHVPDFSGIVYIELPSPITVKKGAYFSIVCENDKGSNLSGEPGAGPGESFTYSTSSRTWKDDYNASGDFSYNCNNHCLKVHAIPVESKGTSQGYKYKIQFMPNTSSKTSIRGYMAPCVALSTNSFSLPECGFFTFQSYYFAGWNTRRDGKGKTYKDKEFISSPMTQVKNDTITLYAQWKKIPTPTISKVKKKSGKISISYKGNPNYSVVQIQLSTSSKFKKSGKSYTKTEKKKFKSKTYTVTIKGSKVYGKKPKTLYVRVRPGVMVNGNIWYLDWSKTKKIKK